MKTTPTEIWGEYQLLTEYLLNNNVYEEVKVNEEFYEGKQWRNLETSNIPTPVVNVLGRSCKYLVASLASNEIAVSLTPFSSIEEDKKRMKVISEEIDNIIESARIKESSRLVIRNGCVDGSGFMMQSFDPEIETGQDAKGAIVNQVIDNTCVYFGNPYSSDVQKQPFIIIALRQDIRNVKKEAKEYGISQELIDSINPDNEGLQPNEQEAENLVTVLIKFFRKKSVIEKENVTIDPITGEEIVNITEEEKNTVWFTKTTREVTLIEPTDLGYTRYPISYFPWEKKKNSYLGVSPMTSVIQNQIFINKTFAIAQMYGLQSAFPKIVYDKSKVNIQEFLEGTSPSAVAGIDIMGKFLDFIKIPDFSNNIIELARETIAQTKDTLGVTDVSLGNVKPDNTSAIIALQEASAVPLEIQKQNFYEFWEDTIRNIIDIMGSSYGIRQVMSSEYGLGMVDFSILKDMNYRLKVEIGAGAQYSEIAQINTLDKYLQSGLIKGSTHAKLVPSKYILGKEELIGAMEEYEQQMMPQANIGQRMLDDNAPL